MNSDYRDSLDLNVLLNGSDIYKKNHFLWPNIIFVISFSKRQLYQVITREDAVMCINYELSSVNWPIKVP